MGEPTLRGCDHGCDFATSGEHVPWCEGPRPWKAADLDTGDYLRLIDRICRDGRWAGMETRWVMTWDLAEALPDVPFKVVHAKARTLIRRKLLEGCPCGCRGDFELTEAGRAFIDPSPPAPTRKDTEHDHG